MSLFSSHPFLEALAEAHYPGTSWHIADVAVAGRCYRTLVVGRRSVVNDVPFLDFLEPRPGPTPPGARAGGYLARAVRQVVQAEAWADTAAVSCDMPAPYVDWSRFVTWHAFVTHAQRRTPAAFRFTTAKRKRMARDLGEVRVVQTDGDAEILAMTLAWKAVQYRRTGHLNQFASARNVALFGALLRRRALAVTALYAGERLAATHVGAVCDGRFYYWLPAHDPELNSYSPGTLLLEHLLRDSHTAGHREFDFLLGGETYKWTYATHVRGIGEVGTPPWRQRAWRSLRPRIATQLQRRPRLLALSRTTRRFLRERGVA